MKKFRMILILAILSAFVVNCPKGKKEDNTGLLLFLLSGNSSATTTSTAPTVTRFTPTSATVGSSVTITGTNFKTGISNNTVKFNGVTATITSASSTTSLTVTVPTGATTGKITVTVDSQTGTSTTDFTVISTTCSTSSSSPTTLTAGTAASNIIIANGDVCYYAFTPTATDIYDISTSGNSNSDGSSTYGNDVNMYVSYGDSSVTGNPTTAAITATTYPGSDADWAVFKQTTSTAETLYLHNVANVKHIIALHAKSCGSAGCSINLSASALNSSTTNCWNTTFSLSATIESGASISGFLNTTNNCVYRLAMKTTTTNSYSLTGLTKDLDLYLGAVGSSSSTAEFTSLQSGTTSESISTKTSTAGSFRYIQVTPYSTTNCSTGGYCSFTLGVTSP